MHRWNQPVNKTTQPICVIVLIQLLAAKNTINVMLMCLNGNDAKVRTGSDYYHIPALVPNEGIHNVNTCLVTYLQSRLSFLLINATHPLCMYRVVQLKWSQLTFLFVKFEWIDKIQWFLVNAITVHSHTLGSIKI